MAGAEASGEPETARLAFLRASNYYRNAGIMLLATPIDERLRASNQRQTAAFQCAAALMEHPPQRVEIPYEQTTLPGYFFKAAEDGAALATVILTSGHDSTVEELYFTNAAAALARGYNVLAFDGPGQGEVLIQRGIPIRPDWETSARPSSTTRSTAPTSIPAALR